MRLYIPKNTNQLTMVFSLSDYDIWFFDSCPSFMTETNADITWRIGFNQV